VEADGRERMLVAESRAAEIVGAVVEGFGLGEASEGEVQGRKVLERRREFRLMTGMQLLPDRDGAAEMTFCVDVLAELTLDGSLVVESEGEVGISGVFGERE
jgi:hypothetical protein